MDAYRRCPQCNALLRQDATQCRECQLLAQFPTAPVSTSSGPRNPVVRFLWALGVPLDLWIAAALAFVWFVILLVAASPAQAILLTLFGFGLPLLMISASGILSEISFWRVPLQESNPIVFRVLAWICMVAFQIWLVYALASGQLA